MALSIILFLLLLTSIALIIITQKNQSVTKKQTTHLYVWAILICTIVSIGCDTQPSKEKTEQAEASEREKRVELASRCDTNYRIISNTELYFKNKKGYFVDFSDFSVSNVKEWLNKPWMASTYKQTGPGTFEIDKTKKLAPYTEVEVKEILPADDPHRSYNLLVVTPVGSTERYIINDDGFTLKDVKSCSFLEKAKSKFYSLAEYTAPADENDRPIDESTNKWIDVPPGAIILVKEYRDTRNTFFGQVYGADGSLVSLYAHFKPETLKEIKR